MLTSIGLALAKVPRWAWIAGGAAVLTLLLLWRSYATGHDAGRNSREPEIAALRADLVTERVNVVTLRGNIERLGKAVDKLAAERETAQKAVAKAEKQAAEARGQSAALRTRLEAASRQTGGSDAPLTKDQEAAWTALQ